MYYMYVYLVGCGPMVLYLLHVCSCIVLNFCCSGPPEKKMGIKASNTAEVSAMFTNTPCVCV